MKLAAQVCPALAFISMGRVGAAALALLMQMTVVGWIPATEWALRSLEDLRDQQRLQRAMDRRYQHRAAGRI